MAASQLNAREISIHNQEHIKRIVQEIDDDQNRQRRADAYIGYQCIEGNQKEFVKKSLANLYPETHTKFRVASISIPKKVIDKKAKAYQKKPIRKLKVDTETEALEAIYDDFHFHSTFKEFDRVYNYHKYAFYWVTWQNAEERDAEEGRYVAHALAPYEFDIIVDQVSGEPIIFILNYPDTNVTRQAGRSDGIEQTIKENQSDTAAQSRVYSMWTKDKFAKVTVTKAGGHGNHKGTKIDVNFVKKSKNMIGRLPGVYIQKDNKIDYPVAQNLADQSIDWNVSFSDLKTASSTQGHGQLVLKHPDGQKLKQIHMGMHTAIALPQGRKDKEAETTAEYISASPDLGGQLSVLKFDLMNILDEQGIKAKGAIEGGVQEFNSGFDRLLSEADVQDIIEDNQGTYAERLEQGVFLTVKAYEEAMNLNTFSKSDSVQIHFEKPKVLISDKETLDNLEKRDELATILDYEKHMILDPNLSKEDAIALELEIQGQKKKKQKEAMDAMKASVVPGDEDEDEDPPNFGAEE